MKTAKKVKRYWEMNAAELAAATSEFDHELSPDAFGPLGPEKRAIWDRLLGEERRHASVKDETGRSDVQQGAENEIRKLLCRRFPGLTKCDVPLKDGSKVEVDAGDLAHNRFIEIYARQGPVKPGQSNKIARDILKLSMLKCDFDPKPVQIGLAYANPTIHSFLTGDSWLAVTVRMFGIDLFNLTDEVSPEVRQTIQAAEKLQAKKRR
jgi:hypothetical protein